MLLRVTVLVGVLLGSSLILGRGSVQGAPRGVLATDPWRLGGNAGTTPGTNFLGTTDNQALQFHVNGVRALRLEPNATSPIVIGGYAGNVVTAGASGATIAGGGSNGNTNRVTDYYGTVGGGSANQAGDNTGLASDRGWATVAGGARNIAKGPFAAVGGGSDNVAGNTVATVAGGLHNQATGNTATIGGGSSNIAGGQYATASGGYQNQVNGGSASIGGGQSNQALYNFATVGGGYVNKAQGTYATVGGGGSNTAIGNLATIGGGGSNTTSGIATTVGGGSGNAASADYATVSGGGPSNTSDLTTSNRVTDAYGTVSGGSNNQAGDAGGTSTDHTSATVGGGRSNTAKGSYATVAGGFNNQATGDSASLGGGNSNTAGGSRAVVGGGSVNSASNSFSTVAGGIRNQATGSSSTVGGGSTNTASGSSATVGGGTNNAASGPYSTIPGGANNIATTQYTFAAGRQAKAISSGSFVWSDSRGFDLYSLSPDSFNARATGGFRFISGIDGSGHETAGVALQAGSGSWSELSDRNAKTNFAVVDSRTILQHLESIPMQFWSYKAQDAAVRHIGPTAQDFYAAFGVGEDNRHISAVDAQGVALTAIQGLSQENSELRARVAALEGRAPAAAPTITIAFGNWGLALLALVVGLLGGFMLRRRVSVAS